MKRIIAIAILTVTLVFFAPAQTRPKKTVPQRKSQISVRFETPQRTWQPLVQTLPNAPAPKLLWQGEPFVHPRGVMLDPDNTTLWISDPGDAEKDPAGKPARVIKVPLENGVPGKPAIFFQKPGFLYSAKWAVPVVVNGRKQLIVADQGQPTSEYTFTGKGAKVFTIPILPDGTAGNPSILWEGKPFRCPTGVALIGKFIYITDPCAGPMRSRPEKPDYKFPSSAIFALNVAGGRPIKLLSGAPFTSLIGICPLIPGELIVNDTDSGRMDPKRGPGRHGFAPEGSADRWVIKILDSNKPRLSKPRRSAFTEEGTVTLKFSAPLPDTGHDSSLSRGNIINAGLRTNNPASSSAYVRSLLQNATIEVVGTGSTRVVRQVNPLSAFSERFSVKSFSALSVFGPTEGQSLRGSQLDQDAKITVTVASDVLADKITLSVRIPGEVPQNIELQKWEDRINIFANNKHGGARPRPEAGGTGTIYDRFTLDNTLGHPGVWIYPDGGGTPIAIAREPLVRPLGGQLDPGGKVLWVTDQATGSLYAIAFPSPETFDKLYGVQKPLR